MGFFSQAVEHLNAVPVFFNVDQFLHHLSGDRAPNLDLVINLNAGNLVLDNLALVPSLCGWRGIPAFPGDALTLLLGEHKLAAKQVASQLGWSIPRDSTEVPKGTPLIAKPLHLGSSVDVQMLPSDGVQILPGSNQIFAEEFIAGFDSTIVVVYDVLAGELKCLGAQVIIPDVEHPEKWIFDAVEKRDIGARVPVELVDHRVSEELARKCVELCQAFGVRTVARIDVRLRKRPEEAELVQAPDCVFIEINTMPTIGPGNSITRLVQHFVESNRSHPSLAWLFATPAEGKELAPCYLIVSGLVALAPQKLSEGQ